MNKHAGERLDSMLPISDLQGNVYQGEQGWLYPESNDRPASYTPPTIEPVRDVIGFASLGISNCQQEWAKFSSSVTGLNPQVRLANGAFGGMSLEKWSDPTNIAWHMFETALDHGNVAPDQLKVVWMKAAPHPERTPGSWPDQSKVTVRDWTHKTLSNLKMKYPSVEIVYLASRIYGGHARGHEPIAYEHGFATKWVVEDYINGGGVPGLWVAWGPYMWASNSPRSDGLVWERKDFEKDKVHPSAQGEQKVASMLANFLSTDPSSVTWIK